MGQNFTKITISDPATEGYTSFGTARIDYDNDSSMELFKIERSNANV